MIKSKLKKILSPNVIQRIRSIELQVKSIAYRTGNQVECPICHHTYREFMPFRYRKKALCPSCKSLERHRFIYLYLKNELGFYNEPLKKVLHFGPEKCLYETVKNNPYLDYTTADYLTTFMPNLGVEPDYVMSIDDIQFPDYTFDVVIVIGILLMVANDLKAIGEVYRILKPGGYAVFNDPVDYSQPFSIAADNLALADRKKFYNGHDQRWYYGTDYGSRIKSQGFSVSKGMAISIPDFDRYGITQNDIVYIAYK